MTSSDILDWSEEVPTDEGIEEYEFRRYPPNAGGQAMLGLVLKAVTFLHIHIGHIFK